MNKNNKSGVEGVHWVKKSKKWRTKITYNYKDIYLGLYKDIESAIKIRKKAEELIFLKNKLKGT